MPYDPKARFLAEYGPAAARASQQTGIAPDVLLAQWGLETGWGRSIIPGTHNLGNIKDPSGRGVSARDNATGGVDAYRAYGTPDAFADDYASLLQRRYPNAIGAGDDMHRFAAALKAGGYAEDPRYTDKLAAIYSGMTGAPGSAAASAGGNTFDAARAYGLPPSREPQLVDAPMRAPQVSMTPGGIPRPLLDSPTAASTNPSPQPINLDWIRNYVRSIVRNA